MASRSGNSTYVVMLFTSQVFQPLARFLWSSRYRTSALFASGLLAAAVCAAAPVYVCRKRAATTEQYQRGSLRNSKRIIQSLSTAGTAEGLFLPVDSPKLGFSRGEWLDHDELVRPPYRSLAKCAFAGTCFLLGRAVARRCWRHTTSAFQQVTRSLG